jgi:hypothetical protein
VLVLLALGSAGCDQGSRDEAASHGPQLHAVQTFPAAGEGTECDVNAPDTCGAPYDLGIEIAFDRFLLPETAVRQSINVFSGTPDNGVFTEPEYDVVRRVLRYKVALEPGARYTVELVAPQKEDDLGFRAFDRAPLEEGPVPLTFDIRTKKTPTAGHAPLAAKSCHDIVEVAMSAGSGGCATSSCHSSAAHPNCRPGEGQDPDTKECVPIPRMGLDLSSEQGAILTAINHVAHETETGNKSGIALEDPVRFGTQMAIIRPGQPETSYLLYKLIRNPKNYDHVDCHAGLELDVGDCRPSAEESSRLREWFVRGEPMPLYDHTDINPLDVQSFIRAGAVCP